jgi:hypothetical protein
VANFFRKSSDLWKKFAKGGNVVDRITLVLVFDFRNECGVLRTRYILFSVSIEEEDKEGEVDVFVLLMLLSRILKETPFQGNKCTLRFKCKNI